MRFMAVPARAAFWCGIGLHKVRTHLVVSRLGDAQVTVKEEITQAARHKRRITGFDMRKRGRDAVRHGNLLLIQGHQGMLHGSAHEVFQTRFRLNSGACVGDNACHERQYLWKSLRSHQLW